MSATKKKTAYLSAAADPLLVHYLQAQGCRVETIRARGNVDPAIACHPDVYLCLLPDRTFFGNPARLTPAYPGDVLYNAAAVGDYLICSRFTDPDLVKSCGLQPVFVPQGYVKCNLVVADGHHVITEDAGIARVLAKIPEIECLKIEPGFVRLAGYRYGFIGGASGRCGQEIIFSGNLADHPQYKEIAAFLEGCGLKIKYFPEFPLTDIGSILISENE